ncbi:MAG: hypothetical protein R3F30_12480 [Planctomycetota bacterium]
MFAALAHRNGLLYVARADRGGRLEVFEPATWARVRVLGPLVGDEDRLDVGGLAVAGDGRLFVSDTARCQVRVFHAFGGPSARIGPEPGRTVPRDRRGIPAWPKGLVVDDQERLWVACGRQAWVHGLQLFAPDGRLLDSVASLGERTRTWAAPSGLALHGGLVWVCDTLEDRLQVVRCRGLGHVAAHALDRDAGLGRPIAVAVHEGHRDVLAREPAEGLWRFDREMRPLGRLLVPGGVEGGCDLCALPDGTTLLCDRHGDRLVAVDRGGGARELDRADA